MDGLAIAASLTEIEKTVVGGVIRTIYQPEQETFVLHLFAGRVIRLLVSLREAAFHLTQLELPYPVIPSPFVMLLRKHVRGGKIVSIEQSGWDRVVTLTVERRRAEEEETFLLVVELLGVRGNLILLRGDRVLAALRTGPRVAPGEVFISVVSATSVTSGATVVYLSARPPRSRAAITAEIIPIFTISSTFPHPFLKILN